MVELWTLPENIKNMIGNHSQALISHFKQIKTKNENHENVECLLPYTKDEKLTPKLVWVVNSVRAESSGSVEWSMEPGNGRLQGFQKDRTNLSHRNSSISVLLDGI